MAGRCAGCNFQAPVCVSLSISAVPWILLSLCHLLSANMITRGKHFWDFALLREQKLRIQTQKVRRQINCYLLSISPLCSTDTELNTLDWASVSPEIPDCADEETEGLRFVLDSIAMMWGTKKKDWNRALCDLSVRLNYKVVLIFSNGQSRILLFQSTKM